MVLSMSFRSRGNLGCAGRGLPGSPGHRVAAAGGPVPPAARPGPGPGWPGAASAPHPPECRGGPGGCRAHEVKNTFTEEFKLQHCRLPVRSRRRHSGLKWSARQRRRVTCFRVRAVTGAVALTEPEAPASLSPGAVTDSEAPTSGRLPHIPLCPIYHKVAPYTTLPHIPQGCPIYHCGRGGGPC
jgi:hypothetical protein